MATALGGRLGRRHKPCSICKKSHPVWWNADKGAWYLYVPVADDPDGKQRKISLGKDHDQALAKWHRIEAGLDTEQVNPTTTSDGILVGELVNLFLESATLDLAPDRYRNTHRFLSLFAEAFGGMSVAAMRIGGVPKIEKWIKSHKTWNGCVPDVVQRIRRLFNWAVENNYIASTPIKALKKPKYGVRVTWFTPEQEAAIIANGNPEFVRGFRMLVLTGARPDEICSLEAEEVHEDGNGLYLLVDHKNIKKTGKKRRIWLVPEAQEIVRQQLKKFPTGRLFRSGAKTDEGYPPLSPEYFCHAMRTVCKKPACKKLGLDDYDLIGGKRQYKYVAYTCRHTYAVRYLTGFYLDAKGLPIKMTAIELAAYMGNSAKMIDEIYGHLAEQTDFLSARLCGRA